MNTAPAHWPTCPNCSRCIEEEVFDVNAYNWCPTCATTYLVRTFPTMRRERRAPIAEDRTNHDEPSCYAHPSKRVSEECVHCGRFMCADCDGSISAKGHCEECVITLDYVEMKDGVPSLDSQFHTVQDLAANGHGRFYQVALGNNQIVMIAHIYDRGITHHRRIAFGDVESIVMHSVPDSPVSWNIVIVWTLLTIGLVIFKRDSAFTGIPYLNHAAFVFWLIGIAGARAQKCSDGACRMIISTAKVSLEVPVIQTWSKAWALIKELVPAISGFQGSLRYEASDRARNPPQLVTMP